MTEEQLLDQLVRVARSEKKEERARIDERWDRLAAGTLSDEETAELRALADESEEARERYEAFAPLDAVFRARLVEKLRAEVLPAETVETTTPVAEPYQRPSQVAPGKLLLFQRWRVLTLGGALAASLAVVVVLMVLMGGNGRSAPLPMYVAEFQGGDQLVRGQSRSEPRDSPAFSRGSRFDLVLRPATAVSGEIEVACFLDRGQALQPWQPDAEVSRDGGAVRIQGTVGPEIDIGPGEWTLWVLVGRPGRLPDLEELHRYLDAAPHRGGDWVLLRTAFTVEDNP